MELVEYIKLVYNEQLKKYLLQEEWLGINYARARPEHLAAFRESLADLGEIGYLLEKNYRVKISLEEKLNGFEVMGVRTL